MKVGPTDRIGLFAGGVPEAGVVLVAGCVRRRRCAGRRRGLRTGALLGSGRCRWFVRRLRHLLGALFGDDDIALLLGGGGVVDGFQCVGPGLSGRLARAGWIELLAIVKRIRRRGIRLSVDRHRLAHILAGIAIGEQGRLGRRAESFTGLLVVGEAGGHSGERDRKIGAVAAADADRAVGTGLRTEIAGRRARSCCCRTDCPGNCPGPATRGVLGTAIILRQRHQNRAALIVAVGVAETAAAQPLEVGGDLVEVRPHLLDLIVDRTALRRLAVEQREKPGTVATHAAGLRGHAIELALLPAGGILVAAHLFVPGRVPAATMVDGRQLGFQPRAHRVHRRRALGRRRAWITCARASRLQPNTAEQDGAGKDPSGEKRRSTFQAYPAITTNPRGSNQRRGQRRLPHSRFSGQRHVVSGAPVWQENP